MEHNGSHGYTVSLLDHDDKEKLREVQRLRYTYLLREFDAGKNDPGGLDDDGYDANFTFARVDLFTILQCNK